MCAVVLCAVCVCVCGLWHDSRTLNNLFFGSSRFISPGTSFWPDGTMPHDAMAIAFSGQFMCIFALVSSIRFGMRAKRVLSYYTSNMRAAELIQTNEIVTIMMMKTDDINKHPSFRHTHTHTLTQTHTHRRTETAPPRHRCLDARPASFGSSTTILLNY